MRVDRLDIVTIFSPKMAFKASSHFTMLAWLGSCTSRDSAEAQASSTAGCACALLLAPCLNKDGGWQCWIQECCTCREGLLETTCGAQAI